MRSAIAVVLAAVASMGAATPIVERQDPIPPVWPYLGRFTETEGNSCGYQLGEGMTNAPKYDDCVTAMSWFAALTDPKWGRQTHQILSCVVVWHPPDGDVGLSKEITKIQLNAAFGQLINGCRTGAEGEYVSNLAYHKIDSTDDISDWGTVEVYYLVGGDSGDGPPLMKEMVAALQPG